MLEEAKCIVRTDRIDGYIHHLHQRLAAASLGLAQHSLDLGEGFFDVIEIR